MIADSFIQLEKAGGVNPVTAPDKHELFKHIEQIRNEDVESDHV